MSRKPAASEAAHGRAVRAIRLSDLRVGAAAHMPRTPLDVELAQLLRAIGLTVSSRFRLCQNGDPCIVQVRSTRIGLSRSVASQIQVVPIADEGR
jgi:Fe2+ transport system protein FeoA